MSALDDLSEEERGLLKKAGAPEKARAMKAVLTDDRFDDPGWIYERKLDGVRCVAIRSGKPARLLSRNDLSMNERYPEVAEALQAQGADRFAVDGEVVAFEGGQTSFSRLARRGRERVAVFFYVFDLTWLDGYDLRDLPLAARKRLLGRVLDFGGPLRLSSHRRRNGVAFYEEACRKGWEGVIAKRLDSRYSSARSGDWLKFKCSRGQEMVIGGYTAPKGSRTVLGALLVGHYAGGELRYSGKVGTGFDRETLQDLGRRLKPLRRESSPFADPPRERDVTWVRPQLVAQLGFSEWTRDGRLRHPRFLGLRFDKKAREVVREG
jgi:bifunctional non-homologous end joining protein LigD